MERGGACGPQGFSSKLPIFFLFSAFYALFLGNQPPNGVSQVFICFHYIPRTFYGLESLYSLFVKVITYHELYFRVFSLLPVICKCEVQILVVVE